MIVAELRKLLASVPAENDNDEVKVWLPGSTISLEFNRGKALWRNGALLIEGNVDPGSALSDD